MQIRKATIKDARRISYLIKRNTEEVQENNYSKEQISIWINANSPKAIEQHLKNRVIFCAFQNDQLVGTIGLQEAEVVGLYVSYSRRGHGIGRRLLRHLEAYARQNHIKTLELTSTPSALAFYKKNNYRAAGPITVNINGVNFKETKMIKSLTPKPSNKTIYQIDAFTDQLFKGNPAGVMYLDSMPADDEMQQIAMEMNLSETAFVVPQKDYFQIRYFTPANELPLAGHPTLASAHLLYELGISPAEQAITFKAKGGTLVVKKEGEWIVMNFPKYPLQKIATPSKIKEIIGFQPSECYASQYDWVIAVADHAKDITNAQPNFALMNENGLGHLMITAQSHSGEEDFVVRCFAPMMGVNEDPVTGSAHCALTPLWAEKLGKMTLRSTQLSKRTGKLRVKLIGDRVEISGKAITVFEAKMR